MAGQRILITRPREEIAGLARELAAKGFEMQSAPMLMIETLAGPFALPGGTQALLFTSSSAVRAYQQAGLASDVPALCVGDATAAACRRSGFDKVASAKGNAADLVALASRLLSPGAGAVVHARGIDTAGDVAATLAKAGFTVEELVLYRAVAASTIGSAALADLRAGTIAATLFFSPRSAETFSRLAANEGIMDALRRVDAYCLSQAIADRLDARAWRGIHVAAKPEQASLLALLDAAA